MSRFMKVDSALARTVLDDSVSSHTRYQALAQMERPTMTMLRKLLVEPKIPRTKPIPNRLRALASLKYAEAVKRKKARRAWREVSKRGNALGI